MVLQLEDCIDCLTMLHPVFDYLFLFDHSCGHDQQQEDGLNAGGGAKGYIINNNSIIIKGGVAMTSLLSLMLLVMCSSTGGRLTPSVSDCAIEKCQSRCKG
jgi:hypothetical protein